MVKKIIILVSLVVAVTSFAADQNCVDQALMDFGIDINMATDTDLLNDILENDMFLATVPGIKEMLGAKLIRSESMAPMLKQAREGILTKHPAMSEFLCSAHERGMLKTVDPVVAKRMLHHMFLLEAIVVGMKNDWRLMVAVNKAFVAKRANYGIGEGALETITGVRKAGGGTFGGAKAATMDGTLKMYGAIRERGSITEGEIQERTKGLALNIREAYATDMVSGHHENVIVGMALNTVSPATLQVAGSEARVEYLYSQDWTSLYQTWNLAFIVGNLDNLHLLLPKLLIPAVMCAEPNDYLFMRSLALWVSLNFSLFAKLEKRANVDMPGAEQLSQLWGEINKEYAMSYLASVKAESKKAEKLHDVVLKAETSKLALTALAVTMNFLFW